MSPIRPRLLRLATAFGTAVMLCTLIVPASAVAAFKVDRATTWQGVLPCADCAGIRTDVTLLPDGTYVLHQSYLGKGEDDRLWTELGRWTAAQSGKRVRLTGADTRYFGVLGERTLRMRDRQDKEIRSSANYNLVRTRDPAPLGGELVARGFYTYRADAALFLHCDSGRKLEVRGGAHALTMERDYLAATQGSGKPVLVTFKAALAPRPADAEGFDTIRVEGEPTLHPGATCTSKTAMTGPDPATLAGRWTFTTIAGQPPSARGRGDAAGLEFRDGRVSAATGCNRMNGGVKLDGSRIDFSKLASTMMACEPDVSAQEKAIGEVLRDARSWRIDDGVLVLAGADGVTLAELVRAVSLDGRWAFTSIGGRPPVDGAKGAPSAEFKAGSVAVATGCNRLAGKTRGSGTQLAMPALAGTRMACADALMAQEKAIGDALRATASFHIDGTKLELLDKAGNVVAELEKR
jgi:copper homeostasis protein (lipoprotein)